MTSKQRAYLKSLAMKEEPIYSIGKSALTPDLCSGVREALDARELVKIHVLQNCTEPAEELARVLSERTGSEVVQVIGKKIILYKPKKDKEKRKIILP